MWWIRGGSAGMRKWKYYLMMILCLRWSLVPFTPVLWFGAFRVVSILNFVSTSFEISFSSKKTFMIQKTMSHSSAARTNLTSNSVQLHTDDVVGEGAFRIAYAGTYVGGNRNSQEAVCKCFKSQYRGLESEFFRSDFRTADKAIQYAEDGIGFVRMMRLFSLQGGTCIRLVGNNI